MSATLKLNKHELLWLAEGAMGKSHLRWDIYPMFVNTIFPQLNDDEREFIYAYLKRDTSWLWENKTSLDETPHQYWLQTLARYNPANQYKVTQRGSSGTMSGYWSTDVAKSGMVFEHNDIDIEEYLPEFYRILKADAHCYIMCNNFNLPHFFEVIDKSDFRFVKLLVWDKHTKICGRYYMGQVEHIFLLRKGKDKPINDCGCSDLLSFSNFKREKDKEGNNLHDSIKPIPLMQCLIENSSQQGEIIFDPFIGSGTTALACIRSNRHYVGCEIDKHYYDVAINRIKQESIKTTLF